MKSTLIFGTHAIIEAIESGHDLERVFVQKDMKGEAIRELLHKLSTTHTPISKVPIEKLTQLTTKNHQGVVAFLSPVKYYDIADLVARTYESGETPLFLALDRVTDVKNFGAIARSAEAMGVHGMIIPKSYAAQINADSMKTSSGALAKLPVCRVDNLITALNYLKSSGLQLIACTEKGNVPIQNAELNTPCGLIMGSEEDGISIELIALCDQVAFIPMLGQLGSLNVSAATAIFLYETARQRAK